MRYVRADERILEPNWLASWVLELFGEVRSALSEKGVPLKEQEEMLVRLLRTNRHREVAELIAKTVPAVDVFTRQQLQWFSHLGSASQAQGIQMSEAGVLPHLNVISRTPGTRANPGPIPQLLWSDSQAQQHFRRVIRNELLEELNIAVTRRTPETQLIRESKTRAAVSLRVAQETVPDTQILHRTERESIQVAGVESVVYLPRLNPLQHPDSELRKLERLRAERPTELAELPLPTETGLTVEQWIGFVTPHIEQALQQFADSQVGNAERIARRFFQELTIRRRKFVGYGEGGAGNFHPPGGNVRHYVVYRVLPLPSGSKVLAWKISRTADEIARTKGNRRR